VNGCTSVYSVIVTSPSALVLNTSAASTLSGQTNGTVSVGATGGSPGYTYSWSTTPSSSSPSVSGLAAGLYTVTVIDSKGCLSIDTVRVIEEKPCGELFIPTAFSPNGDGVNDVFRIRTDCLEAYHLMVFDRWGELVFETADLSSSWDGRYHARPMDAGVYIYVLKG